jgi:uncharacterized RDD family membrane protein YckC
MSYAGFWKRFFARFIDSAIFFCFSFTNTILFYHANQKNLFIVSSIISFVEILYFVLFTYYKGATLGKLALGIRVTKTDGTKVNFSNSFFRESLNFTHFVLFVICNVVFDNNIVVFNIVLSLTSLLIIAGDFMYFFNQKRQTLYDFIADTVVIDLKVHE